MTEDFLLTTLDNNIPSYYMSIDTTVHHVDEMEMAGVVAIDSLSASPPPPPNNNDNNNDNDTRMEEGATTTTTTATTTTTTAIRRVVVQVAKILLGAIIVLVGMATIYGKAITSTNEQRSAASETNNNNNKEWQERDSGYGGNCNIPGRRSCLVRRPGQRPSEECEGELEYEILKKLDETTCALLDFEEDIMDMKSDEANWYVKKFVGANCTAVGWPQ